MSTGTPLAKAHLDELVSGSGIAQAVIEERGYASVWGPNAPELLAAGFKEQQRRGAGWLAPLHSPLGTTEKIFKPNDPRELRGKKNKYEYPQGRAPILDAHPRTLPLLGDPNVRLFVTEGIKKGDALVSRGEAAIALQGVFGWRGKNPAGGTAALADWESVALKGRSVYVAFDSDASSNSNVQNAQNRLARFLLAKGATVSIIHLPSGEAGAKQGVDDFFIAGGTVESLLSHAEPYGSNRERSTAANLFSPQNAYPQSDAGNAEVFSHLYSRDLRFDHKRNRWLLWRNDRWQEDTQDFVYQLAKKAARWRFHEAENIADLTERAREAVWAAKSENRSRIESVLVLARSEAGIAEDGEGWDAQPFLMGVRNGVIDLRTGELREARREDKITRQAPVTFDPAAACPVFDKFLARVVPDAELRAYLQRRAGYALTGDTSEQDLLFLHGGGSNGKSTLVNALMDVLGRDYALQAAPGLLLQKRGESHPTEIADLDGARLVVSTEIDDGRALAEGLVKQLTGGDRLKARRMRQDFYEFEATFKLMLLANHKPNVRGTDWAIWRRIKLVPFDQTITNEEKDPHLREKLAQEASGILNWMLAGCLDWQHNGMREPESVSLATAEYRTESDPLTNFLQDVCVIGEHCRVGANTVYLAYTKWADLQALRKYDTLSGTAFGKQMVQRFRRVKGRKGNFYEGIGLLTEHQESMPVEGLPPRFESDVEGFEDFPVNAEFLRDREGYTENYPQPSTPSTSLVAIAQPWEAEV